MLLRKVSTDGKVTQVRAACLLRNQPWPLSKRQRQPAVLSTVGGQVRVSAAPKCSIPLRIRVVIKAKRSGAKPATWQRTWRVRDTTKCALPSIG